MLRIIYAIMGVTFITLCILLFVGLEYTFFQCLLVEPPSFLPVDWENRFVFWGIVCNFIILIAIMTAVSNWCCDALGWGFNTFPFLWLVLVGTIDAIWWHHGIYDWNKAQTTPGMWDEGWIYYGIAINVMAILYVLYKYGAHYTHKKQTKDPPTR